MREPEALFNTNRLYSMLQAQAEMMSEEIEALPAERILASTVDAVTDHFEDRYMVDPIVLHEDQVEVSTHEADVDVRSNRDRFIPDRSRPFLVKGSRYVLHVPFSGDAKLFGCQPSTYFTSPPSGLVAGTELQLSMTTTRQDAAEVNAELERQLSAVRTMIANVALDVGRFNAELRSAIRQRVEKRRDKVLADKKTTDSLKFPIRKRTGQPDYIPVPVARRVIRPLPTPSPATPFKPEHAVSMEEYEDILKCIRSMAIVMERSPSSFAHMEEERIRDQFLVPLNSQFEGAATGETFNFSGKTDILIRVDDANVFIAECKFWRGEKSFVEAIDQLLGYACWRDTKLALLVFNRNKNLSAVVEKIGACLRAHPNFLRQGTAGHETSIRCVLHHRDDRARELTLTVVVFEIPVEPELPSAT